MKRIVPLSLFATCALAFALQDTVRFERTYQIGESDDYNLKMAMTTELGEIEISLRQTQTVKKVFEDGSADIEFALKQLKVFALGQEHEQPNQPPKTVRMTKNGVPANFASTARSGGMNLAFARFTSVLPDKPLKVGEVVEVNFADTENMKSRVNGTIKLESLKDGVAKLLINLQIHTDGLAKPIKVAESSLLEVATSKLNRSEATISDLPSAPGMDLQVIQLIIERVKTGEATRRGF